MKSRSSSITKSASSSGVLDSGWVFITNIEKKGAEGSVVDTVREATIGNMAQYDRISTSAGLM